MAEARKNAFAAFDALAQGRSNMSFKRRGCQERWCRPRYLHQLPNGVLDVKSKESRCQVASSSRCRSPSLTKIRYWAIGYAIKIMIRPFSNLHRNATVTQHLLTSALAGHPENSDILGRRLRWNR